MGGVANKRRESGGGSRGKVALGGKRRLALYPTLASVDLDHPIALQTPGEILVGVRMHTCSTWSRRSIWGMIVFLSDRDARIRGDRHGRTAFASSVYRQLSMARS